MSAVDDAEPAEQLDAFDQLSRADQIAELQKRITNANKWHCEHVRTAVNLRSAGRYSEAELQDQYGDTWRRKLCSYQLQLADLIAREQSGEPDDGSTSGA